MKLGRASVCRYRRGDMHWLGLEVPRLACRHRLQPFWSSRGITPRTSLERKRECLRLIAVPPWSFWFCAGADQWTVATTGTPASSAARMKAAWSTLAGYCPGSHPDMFLPPRYLPRRRPLPICPRQLLSATQTRVGWRRWMGYHQQAFWHFVPASTPVLRSIGGVGTLLGTGWTPGAGTRLFGRPRAFFSDLARLRPDCVRSISKPRSNWATAFSTFMFIVPAGGLTSVGIVSGNRRFRPTGSLPTTRSTNYGEASPLGKLVEAGGKVLMVGAPSTR
ncbi:hypothetical protein FHX14_000591 [Rhizobium sp. BK619]|nr:hypothetical protein [Rhizobium sp. BK619]